MLNKVDVVKLPIWPDLAVLIGVRIDQVERVNFVRFDDYSDWSKPIRNLCRHELYLSPINNDNLGSTQIA